MTAKVDIDDRLVDVGTDKTNREVGNEANVLHGIE